MVRDDLLSELEQKIRMYVNLIDLYPRFIAPYQVLYGLLKEAPPYLTDKSVTRRILGLCRAESGELGESFTITASNILGYENISVVDKYKDPVRMYILWVHNEEVEEGIIFEVDEKGKTNTISYVRF